MRQISTTIWAVTAVGCGGWKPADWLFQNREPPATCQPEALSELLVELDSGIVQAPLLVQGLKESCSEVLSPSLVRALDRWGGSEPSTLSELPPMKICGSLDWTTPLESDRPAQMNRVYKECRIQADGLFDLHDFEMSSGPYGGLVGSRLYRELSEGQVSATRAVELSQIIAGSPARAVRSVYGDHAAQIWRVSLVQAQAPRLRVPGCTPTVVADSDWVRWQDWEWISLSDGQAIGLVVDGAGPPHLHSGAQLVAWRGDQVGCEGKGKTVLVAMEPTLSMSLARPLLWTLDGLDGYHPTLVVRGESATSDSLSEASPLGGFELRLVDVGAFENDSMNSLFLVPETRVLLSEGGEPETSRDRGAAWLPGVRLELRQDAWRLFDQGELVQQGKGSSVEQLETILLGHTEQIRREGLVLTLGDRKTVAELIAWLEPLQRYSDAIMLDARAPRAHSLPD